VSESNKLKVLIGFL